MIKILLLLFMIFCHIVDDYYLQGWLASAKQKSWWEKNCSNVLYQNDYIMALIMHAFSWTFMIHIPIIIYLFYYNININICIFIIIFLLNWFIHAFIDHLKANLFKINLIQDQIIHIIQILITYFIYVIYYFVNL